MKKVFFHSNETQQVAVLCKKTISPVEALEFYWMEDVHDEDFNAFLDENTPPETDLIDVNYIYKPHADILNNMPFKHAMLALLTSDFQIYASVWEELTLNSWQVIHYLHRKSDLKSISYVQIIKTEDIIHIGDTNWEQSGLWTETSVEDLLSIL